MTWEAGRPTCHLIAIFHLSVSLKNENCTRNFVAFGISFGSSRHGVKLTFLFPAVPDRLHKLRPDSVAADSVASGAVLAGQNRNNLSTLSVFQQTHVWGIARHYGSHRPGGRVESSTSGCRREARTARCRCSAGRVGGSTERADDLQPPPPAGATTWCANCSNGPMRIVAEELVTCALTRSQ